MRALGLDVGERRLGVALSDPGKKLAFPLTVIHRMGGEEDIEALKHLVRKHEVDEIVIGLPFSLDGNLGPQARRVMEFVEELTRALSLPVILWDERLSTVEASRRLREVGVKDKAAQDTLAAVIVLQNYLDGRKA